MPKAIAGIDPKGDGLVHNHRPPLIIALAPIMAEVAGLQEEGEDARCFSAPLPVEGIQGQGLDRHSKIIGRKSGEGLPFTHQAHFCQSPFQQIHIHFGAIGPQAPA